jgi:hypothetical protein
LLYCWLLIARSSWRPSILALPMFVRSRKLIKYSRHSQGMRLVGQSKVIVRLIVGHKPDVKFPKKFAIDVLPLLFTEAGIRVG